MLSNKEIVVAEGPDGPRPEAVFDLSETQIAALDEALAHYRRSRFASAPLDADGVMSLREIGTLGDTIHALAGAGGHAVVQVDAGGAAALARAARGYVRDRDTEGYQSPEERSRLAALAAIVEPLGAIADELRAAGRE
jgi:hypothetical protein